VALMVALVYKKRALPLVWMVSKGKKEHFSEEAHIALIREVAAWIPTDARVVFLGDGEFDGCYLQALLQQWGWQYVCRTACNVTLRWESETFQFEDMAMGRQPGDCLDVPNCLFTHKRYGPVLALCWWRKDCKEPIYLVSNMASPEDACGFYAQRFHIETFFSDEKSRGFNLHKSHLSDPARLGRLMIGPPYDRSVSGVPLDHLSRLLGAAKWLAALHPSLRPLRPEPLSTRITRARLFAGSWKAHSLCLLESAQNREDPACGTAGPCARKCPVVNESNSDAVAPGPAPRREAATVLTLTTPFSVCTLNQQAKRTYRIHTLAHSPCDCSHDKSTPTLPRHGHLALILDMRRTYIIINGYIWKDEV
jgi:hypothetical protein